MSVLLLTDADIETWLTASSQEALIRFRGGLDDRSIPAVNFQTPDLMQIASRGVEQGNIRNKSIADWVSEARDTLRRVNMNTLSVLDTLEDNIRNEVINTPPGPGREPLLLATPISVGSRVSVHRAVNHLHNSYDSDISSEQESAAIPKAARLFAQTMRKRVPGSPAASSAHGAFADAYRERMKWDLKLQLGWEAVLYGLERIDPADQFRSAARGAVYSETLILNKYSSNRNTRLLSEKGWDAESRLSALGKSARQDAIEEREERAARAARERARQREGDSRSSNAKMGSHFDLNKAPQIMFPPGFHLWPVDNRESEREV